MSNAAQSRAKGRGVSGGQFRWCNSRLPIQTLAFPCGPDTAVGHRLTPRSIALSRYNPPQPSPLQRSFQNNSLHHSLNPHRQAVRPGLNELRLSRLPGSLRCLALLVLDEVATAFDRLPAASGIRSRTWWQQRSRAWVVHSQHTAGWIDTARQVSIGTNSNSR